tara:strand:- start:138 stop:581 length:444 start_codon:yes stop_codon:yes gene_type:complete
MIKLADLQDMWVNDCKIDDLNLGKESTKTPELHAKYLNHLSTARLQLRKANTSLIKLKRIKSQYFRGELSKEELNVLGWDQYLGNKPLKSEIYEYLEADDDIIQQADKLEYIQTTVDYLDRVLRAIQSRGWDIKNSIEWTKFTNGLM